MAGFLQACAGLLIAVILILTLGNHGKEMASLLGIGACCMVALAAMTYLRPVIDFLSMLETLGGLDGKLVKLLLKAAGIGMLSEIAALICSDAGNASLGKAAQILGTAVILWLSLPLFSALMELLQKILGAI